ncbi:MAG: hypothetical protein COU81_03650 [Candidatus Portnoybacteria bacterium CG10_big_fil_rev_8_21_14_0_10_36_7]|uniref:Amino acid transporter transmembrane domain-containing protein n=1 Tax=Candidatus Portnoybacteria bacterium CG10_big_fil_rev_8_21_14_0_10_36_7 TaxID=1974812 RepID=A0A2M8KD52_9BACT|nr:MAG: hypothetical protein COU81_03650 [Candidatus Portnoybacteria bacterium CG10_big_fil_rev_8_21_14_0_10_36_7]
MNKKYWLAIATMAGTIIGVGMFGLPYVSAQSGLSIGIIYLVLLTCLTAIFHLSYGEIVLRTKEEFRFVGYGGWYLGAFAKKILTLSTIGGLIGGQIAYIIVGGIFLNEIFISLGYGLFFWQIVNFVIASLIVFFGLRIVSRVELWMSGFLVLVIVFVFFSGLPYIDIGNFTSLNMSNIFLPYGVVLFSLFGGVAVPEVVRLLKGRDGEIKDAILWGTFIPGILYILFVITVLGIVGASVTSEPVSDLVPYLGRVITFGGFIFGFIACFTSYISFGEGLKKIFQLDLDINKILSWAMSMVVPFLFFLSLQDESFINIIGLVGAVFGGINSAALMMILQKAKIKGDRSPEYSLRLPILAGAIITFLMLLGVVLQIIYWQI